MPAKKTIHPGNGYAIVDYDGRLIEDGGSGKLAIYYSMDDATFALPAILRIFPKASIEPVAIHKPIKK